MKQLDLDSINQVYTETFGRTPLKDRLKDIEKESIELTRFIDYASLEEETSDLLCSVLQLINECNFDITELINMNLDKIIKRKKQYQSLGRKYQIAILGGAFDPPTLGHIAVAKYVLSTSGYFDEVWLMPCFQHMNGKKMQNDDHRLKMCKIASRNDGRIKVSDYEVKHKLLGETYHLVKRMLNDPEISDRYNISFIIGLDNALTFEKWVNYESLEKMIRFVVVPRNGVTDDLRVNWFRNPPHIWIPFDENGKGVMPKIKCSSTLLRKLINENYNNLFIEKYLYDYVDKKVLEYIRENELYR